MDAHTPAPRSRLLAHTPAVSKICKQKDCLCRVCCFQFYIGIAIICAANLKQKVFIILAQYTRYLFLRFFCHPSAQFLQKYLFHIELNFCLQQ